MWLTMINTWNIAQSGKEPKRRQNDNQRGGTKGEDHPKDDRKELRDKRADDRTERSLFTKPLPSARTITQKKPQTNDSLSQI
jgi:hypothetical protein